MTTDLEALVVAAYVVADEYPVPARPGRPPEVTDAELVALAVCQAAMGISSDRQFLGLVERILPGWFPHLPSQSQYNRRLRALVELIAAVQQRLARFMSATTFMLVEDVAERHGVSVRKVHELTRQGLIPHRVLPHGRRLLFTWEHLEAWENGCELERIDLPAGGRIVRPKGAA